jgi:cell division transport system permease protein
MYTTIRLTIYMAREEIGIMRLVGASRAYVRAPFIVEGILYGVFAWLVTLVIFLPTTYLLGVHASDVIGMNLFGYYTAHLFSVGGIVLLVGIVLGTLSSLLAVRRYLNV